MQKVKIPKALLKEALTDLNRPHAFAAERVGFFSTKCSTAGKTTLVHCVAYHSVPDEHYLRDHSVGVRIGSAAITDAMARSVVASVGQLHVHSHGGVGIPSPSGVDSAELPPLGCSLHNVDRRKASGWAVLTGNGGLSSIVLPGDSKTAVELAVAVVGNPMTIPEEIGTPQRPRWSWRQLLKKRKTARDRFDRQSFLGRDSDTIFARLRVGIVGLGGGGSHIAQQLAHLGIKRFVLCDHDRISETNLNRTVGATEADVKRKNWKTAIAERTVRALHDDAEVVRVGRWEVGTEHLMQCDIIVGCVDTFGARRDLEAFCRRHLIPYVDIGMDVQRLGEQQYEITGQVILSMPGKPCMHCMNFLNDEILAEEARRYGAAGERPQVVWSNGVLGSAAVGIIADLATGWSRGGRDCSYLNFRGSDLSLRDDPRLQYLSGSCPHYPLVEAGDPTWKPL
jgi:molybdopterin/thiamine biosynthesis adenylyltransferase